MQSMLGDTVNARTIGILLECNLVFVYKNGHYFIKRANWSVEFPIRKTTKTIETFLACFKNERKTKGKEGNCSRCVVEKWQFCRRCLLPWCEQGNCIKFSSLPFLSRLSVMWHKQYRHSQQLLLFHLKRKIVKCTFIKIRMRWNFVVKNQPIESFWKENVVRTGSVKWRHSRFMLWRHSCHDTDTDYCWFRGPFDVFVGCLRLVLTERKFPSGLLV